MAWMFRMLLKGLALLLAALVLRACDNAPYTLDARAATPAAIAAAAAGGRA